LWNATESAFVERGVVSSVLHRSSDGRARWHAMREGEASGDLGRDLFAFSLLCGYQFAASCSCNAGERFAGFSGQGCR
jgi:hypothetical protein